MSITADFSELETLRPFFEDQEKIMNASTKGAFSKGGTAALKILRGATPSAMKKFNSTLTSKSMKPRNGIIQSIVGYFGRRLLYSNRRGVQWDAFYMLYWLNYGTLQNRDSSQKFQYSIRPKSQGKMGGIKSRRFFNNAADQALAAGMSTVEESFDKELEKNVIKYGFK